MLQLSYFVIGSTTATERVLVDVVPVPNEETLLDDVSAVFVTGGLDLNINHQISKTITTTSTTNE